VRFGELELSEAHLDLAARYGVSAALDEEMLHTLLGVERAVAGG
jgi:hypothetical protein